ncbi:MAG: nitronate monooxygenase [Verrucomicrobia bacterium]|nr:nitronate monooxygenase [Verrucomicrobiota bacterium]
MAHPRIIQGGMGVAVSGWALARTVSKQGQLGVISGTALAHILARRLQLGDSDGKMRHALSHLPLPGLGERIISTYFVPGGKKPDAPFKGIAMPSITSSHSLIELTIAGNFVETFLAKEGHDGVVGINLLEKIQFPTLASIFGAMLAGIDYVLMGAGIPRAIPGVLDRFAKGEAAELKIDTIGDSTGEANSIHFDPSPFLAGCSRSLKRPFFLAIVASATLALTLARKSTGKVDGFIVEMETAGGHNAPPRGPLQLTPEGEPLYGPRDIPDIEKIHAIGLPFWLAGSYGAPGKLAEAMKLGAAGIQAGTAFAFCEESGIDPVLRQRVIQLSLEGKARVFTDPVASPTGFPFKVVQLDGSLSTVEEYGARPRICDMGYLRHVYKKEDGSPGYRCPSEPIDDYLKKGGTLEETVGRKCICNGLMATVGLGQKRTDGTPELPILTAGNEVANVARFLKPGTVTYTAADVIDALLA